MEIEEPLQVHLHMLINGVENLREKWNKKKVNRQNQITLKSEAKEVILLNRSDFLIEDGSISPLIIFYFSIVLFLTFIITNIGAAYISHRELTSRAEAALSIAAQELDEFKYYYSSPITENVADISIQRGEFKVPIDCTDANIRFREILSIGKEDANLVIRDFECNGRELFASVEEQRDLIFQLRFLNITSFHNRVSVATDSTYLMN